MQPFKIYLFQEARYLKLFGSVKNSKRILLRSINCPANRCTGVPKIVYMVTSQGVKFIYILCKVICNTILKFLNKKYDFKQSSIKCNILAKYMKKTQFSYLFTKYYSQK